MTAALLPTASSAAALAPANPLQRAPRAPRRARPAPFHAAFDGKTLFYDCFRHVDGRRILLVGPPPMNLRAAFNHARFRASPGGELLRPRFFRSLSTMITALEGAEPATDAISVELGGECFELPVQPNASAELTGRRLLFSMNKDNDLAWIAEWALFHARVHGTDAIVLYDNGSTRYAPAEVLDVLARTPGLAHVGVPSWPQPFGMRDDAVIFDPYWAHFLQISSMSAVLRRYGATAQGVLDCDVDELAGTHSGRSIYDLARASRAGLIGFRGRWIEATPTTGRRHRDFALRHIDPRAALSRPRKWALDPSRAWVHHLGVHPYWHRVEGRPLLSRSAPDDAFYWHFKGINTNWKLARRAAPPSDARLEPDGLLLARLKALED